MYALVTNVSIAPGQFEESRKALNDQVVPRVKQAPGLVKAFWTIREDLAQGTSIVVFKTKQDAEAASAMVRNSPPPPGVTMISADVREVVAEA
ncbi:MAG TPA: hypothetical protein VFU28_10805 [Vicinamibacterales bacterium]|nr:hypothetical protein [Vicinamibacterales bacterium]